MSNYYLLSESNIKKFNFLNFQVIEFPRVDSKYIFICNSFLRELNAIARQRKKTICVEDVWVEADSGVPVFIIKASFKIDINLLTSYDLLFLIASKSV